MLMFFKNIPTVLLWKIFKVFRVSFRFYHLHTFFIFIVFHSSGESPFKVAVFLFISLSNFWSLLEHCLNPQCCRRWNTSMKFHKDKSEHITVECQLSESFFEQINLHCTPSIHCLHLPLLSFFFLLLKVTILTCAWKQLSETRSYKKRQCKDICYMCSQGSYLYDVCRSISHFWRWQLDGILLIAVQFCSTPQAEFTLSCNQIAWINFYASRFFFIISF